MKNYIKYILPSAAMLLTVGMTSCTKDLEVEPIDPNLQTEVEADQLFNKCYAVMAVAGNYGADGGSDVQGIDGGTSGYFRQMWNSNELPTDEAICGWGDDGIASFCYNSYNASHPMLRGYYYRLYVAIDFANQYLSVFGDQDATKTAEVRFLRALHYYLLMDAFGNVPFCLQVSTANPPQYTRAEIYNFVESELLEVEPLLADAKAKKSSDAGYGRVDKAAAWFLLMRLYLNAEVYTGTAQWAKAAQYAKKVMDSPYKLYTGDANGNGVGGYSPYQMLFMGDNGETDAAYEAIFPLLQDGQRTTSYGTTFFLMASTTDGSLDNGTTGQWAGNRARPDLIRKFFPRDDAPEVGIDAMPIVAGDDRALFDGIGRTLNNTDVSTFTNGFAIQKFNNFKTDGSVGSDTQFPDADMFFFRKAEAYLTYAEAMARQNGGVATGDAAEAINTIRNRAHASTNQSTYDLDDILDEWSREFYFEGRRRVDLIRFGKFGGNNNYAWQWKGGSYDGRNFEAFKNIFAIPTTDLTVNSNLVQNPGY